MNEENQLEKQLRSWMPRRPSAKLKSRVFASQPGADLEGSWHFSWRYFAPFTGVLLLSAVSFSNRNLGSVYLASGANGMLAAVALSNQTAASYFMSPDTCDRNRVPLESFGTINSRSAPSSRARSVLLFNTNSLIP